MEGGAVDIRIQGKTNAREYGIKSVTLELNGATYILKSSNGTIATGRGIRGFFEVTLADPVFEPITPDAPALDIEELSKAKPMSVDAELTGESNEPLRMEVLSCWPLRKRPATPQSSGGRRPVSASSAAAPQSSGGRRPVSASSAAAARPHPARRPEPIFTKPPEPWRTHRDDFLCVPRTPEIDEKEKAFEKQVALLAETVTPIDFDNTIFRSCGRTINHASTLFGRADAYVRYLSHVRLHYCKPTYHLQYIDQTALKPVFELVCFRADAERTAFLHEFSDFAQVPFQGIGGFGLAIVPSSVKRADIPEILTKVALSQFLGIAPPDLEYIVVTRASKLNLKRIDELKAAGIPVVFDFSGRTQASKQAIDPLAGAMFKEERRTILRYTGRLTEEQADKLGDTIGEQQYTGMVASLENAVYGRSSGSSFSAWSFDMISTLTFGRETVPDSVVESNAQNDPVRRSFLQQAPQNVPWPMRYADFPPECMPTNDAAKAITRMHDVGAIWRKTLKNYGLQLFETRGPRRGSEVANFDRANLQDIGTYLGIDAMIESLYNGVPLDYII